MDDFYKFSDLQHKMVTDYKALASVVTGLRLLQNRIVVTIGTWDLLHIGHVRYLRKAKEKGDILIVGVDTDNAAKKYKGDLRPIVPFEERCEMLSYQTCVDIITPIDDVDLKKGWGYSLIKEIRPDIFVAVEDSYPKKQVAEIKKYSKEILVLPRQAIRTSTSKMIQYAVKKHLEKVYELIEKR